MSDALYLTEDSSEQLVDAGPSERKSALNIQQLLEQSLSRLIKSIIHTEKLKNTAKHVDGLIIGTGESDFTKGNTHYTLHIAEHYGLSALHSLAESADPWAQLFALAASQRKGGQSDLIPYWIFEEGTSRVERRVPLLPYSKESIKFKSLKRDLALYRIVFGQPRQEDLLCGLKHSGYESLTDMAQWLISLEPPKV
ncbi:hypothetical protein [Pectobacterium sp. 21LCBS03]|uniref:hypothetical protein n=1 Tax=Pectobacterium sp. 21LCBS03 TaxID=2935858 RepID=UPI00200C10A1|nr:hypothetical protein [Pectobacterium sp. 21LCBS03]UPY96565.1 hypothetical protein MYB54_07675 [Pectobacterium sp. 21LCBS03]